MTSADLEATRAQPTISVQGIRKVFTLHDPQTGQLATDVVLEDITLEIRKGQFVALFGPNGCGKTTFLKILSGLEPADAGHIQLVGTSRTNFKVGMVFQNYRDSLLPWRTALDNVAFPLELKGLPRAYRRAKAAQLLEEFGGAILDRSDFRRFPYQLSGGQQQLIAIARALINDPDLLLMDESFAALDHDTRYLMQDILTRIWEARRFFIVFVSHSVWEAVYLADLVALFTSKPARIAATVPIPLPRPRTREAEYSSHFFELRSQILRVFERDFYAGQAGR